MCIGIAAGHGGFESKVQLTAALEAPGYAVVDKMPDRQIAAEGSKVLCEMERGQMNPWMLRKANIFESIG
jgi:hypothetical protein